MKYYRRSNYKNGGELPYYLMVEEEKKDLVLSYGQYEFCADDEGAVEVEELIEDIREAFEKHLDIIEEYDFDNEGYEVVIDRLLEEINPPSIVDNAGIWDNTDYVQIIWDEVLDIKNILKLRTKDGLIVFSEGSIINNNYQQQNKGETQ